MGDPQDPDRFYPSLGGFYLLIPAGSVAGNMALDLPRSRAAQRVIRYSDPTPHDHDRRPANLLG